MPPVARASASPLASGDGDFHRASVLALRDETEALRAVRFHLGPLASLHRSAGQVVRVRVGGVEGYYALASAPSDAAGGSAAEIVVKRGGASAEALLEQAAAGRRIEVSAPFGVGFPVAKLAGREVLLFAAGSGIAPIRALLRELRATRTPVRRVALYYGQRGEREFAFTDERAAWERAGVAVHLCCTRPGPGWRGARGRVHEVARTGELVGLDPLRAVACLCGMDEMVADTRALLVERGLAAERILVNV